MGGSVSPGEAHDGTDQPYAIVIELLGNELAEAVAHLESVLVRRPRRD